MEVSNLSDNQRRWICRISFIACCVAPTFMTVYWMLHPQTAEQWQQRIEAQLGVNTKIESIETPQPYETILRELEFSDPELGILLKTNRVRIITGAINRIIVDDTIRVSSLNLLSLFESINQRLLRTHETNQPWLIEINKAIVSSSNDSGPTNALVLSPLRMDVQPDANGTLAKLEFQNESEPGNLVELFVHRSHGNSDQRRKGEQRVFLNTHSGYLPTWLASDLVPEFRHFGSECEFNGHLEVMPTQSETNDSYECQLSGVFRNIDMGKWTSPYKQILHGRCTADISNMAIRNGQIHLLEARLACDSGSIGSSFLGSAVKHLGFALPKNFMEPLAGSDKPIGFRNLQLDCSIRGDQLLLSNRERRNVFAFDVNGHDLTGCDPSIEEIRKPIDKIALFLVQPKNEREFYSEEIVGVLNCLKLKTVDRIANSKVDAPTTPDSIYR